MWLDAPSNAYYEDYSEKSKDLKGNSGRDERVPHSNVTDSNPLNTAYKTTELMEGSEDLEGNDVRDEQALDCNFKLDPYAQYEETAVEKVSCMNMLDPDISNKSHK